MAEAFLQAHAFDLLGFVLAQGAKATKAKAKAAKAKAHQGQGYGFKIMLLPP